jgi:predicted transcriptional regulator
MVPVEVATMARVKEELMRELDQLPPEELAAVRNYVRVLRQQPEELTLEERADVEAGEAEIARGEWVNWEDIRRTKCIASG